MIVLSRKRIIVVMCIVMVSMFAFVFQTASTDKTVQTVSLPVSQKVIVVDAGHRKAR